MKSTVEPGRGPDSPAPRPPHLATGRPADHGQFVLDRRARLVRPLLPTRAGHLVDFGCGNGAQTFRFLDHFEQVTGVDVVAAELDAFTAESRRLGLEARVRTVLTDGGPLPLADGCADVVTSFTVLEHVGDERAALREMRRVLKPRGLLVVTVPNRWWLFETHGADLPLLRWNRVPLVSWWPKRLHDRWARARIYRRREIVALLTECGFEPVESLRLTAPMDVLPAKWLRTLARTTLFRPDRTPWPFLATEILVAARLSSRI
jgi:ubiquinone/menaquinone biosynthesis C-methylase UbiE